MKLNTLTLAVAGVLVGACGAQAQFSYGFGEFTATTQSDEILVDTQYSPSTMTLTGSVDIQTGPLPGLYVSTFRPSSGTPAGVENYTVTVTGLQLRISTLVGEPVTPVPDPRNIILPDIVFNFSYNFLTEPDGNTDYNIPDVTPYSISSQTINLAGTGTESTFTVTWQSVTSVVVAGTKGVSQWDARAYVYGDVVVVPEPGCMALLAGLGLIGFGTWRRARQ
jgi:hypothetical protein